ncbi:hypothetical protein HCU01_01290 [Halomonas cupida]|uniref:TubC N-terminal docking domain-containing protein n=1 Tax=Halomonas cupida TaxID=44933 RepID=A0A1M7B1A5_9GAMM|nr:hypothetical protein [Halomonas cupida]GEN22180.1 hypothetical protein HCU01_01290 [Halomonas cupida]SHL48724.1 hypothetical protein SAMN05660971_00720 [Halomonas cupida]
MAAIDYLREHGLYAEAACDGRLSVWPVQNITPELRTWIRAHKQELLDDIAKGLDPRRRCWRVVVGRKSMVMLSRYCQLSPEEALEVARARWSEARVYQY